jgi:VirE N-terminal domain
MSTAPTVSMVKDAYKTETRDVPADKVIAAIRNGKWRSFIEEIRLEQDKETQDKMKVALPGVLFSGKFSERKNEAIIRHSGLLCADLDNLNGELQNAREKLVGSLHTWGLFTSTRGEGLKAVFRVPADVSKHKASWRATEKLVKDLTGIQIDEACKDPARLCFVSDDPDAYYNPNAQELTPVLEP